MKGEGSIDIAANARAATWLPLLLFPLLSGVPIAAGSLLQLLMLTLLNRYKHRCITSRFSLSLSPISPRPLLFRLAPSMSSSLSLVDSIAKASSGSTIKMNRPEEIFR